MRFLPDQRLYTSTEHCLAFLRNVAGGDGPSKPAERFHVYWSSGFGSKQAFAVKSFLATQDLQSAELWLWLDSRSGYDGYERNSRLRPLLPFIKVKRFDPEIESRDTPLGGRPEFYTGVRPAAQSDFFRFVVLFRHGGTYVDMDMMFLRDMHALLHGGYFHDEFCYQWSCHVSHGNSAVLRLRQGGAVAGALLAKCAARGMCHPKQTLHFEQDDDLDLLVLPCVFFDPLWPHYDRRDLYAAAPFGRFADFYRRFGVWFHRRPEIESYRDFFPGAFAYHWHNFWEAREHNRSYFGLFNDEFDRVLNQKLGIRCPGA
jgi:hypothetical protein